MSGQPDLYDEEIAVFPAEQSSSVPADQQEDLDDLDLREGWYTGPTLWSTDWTTETVVSQLRRKNINLNPRFQRRNAWTPDRKSLFIESLLLGLPVPQLILAEEKGKKGSFIVIDGKQRLLTLRQFASEPTDEDFPQLRLTGLKDRPELNGVTYKKLSDEDQFSDDLNSFDNQTIRTVVIRNWTDEKYLYSVFLRINTGSVQLSPQELRQALHPGDFSDFIDDVSVERAAIKNVLKLRQPDFRMRDVELVLRYFAYRNFIREYDGNLKRFLDSATSKLNKSWPEERDRLGGQADDLDAALGAVREIFGQRDEVRKWNGKTYERRINRAVFDVMAYYFSDPNIRQAAIEAKTAVKGEFQRLCQEDRDFVSSIESTTKSKEANRIRFSVWARALAGVINLPVESPLG